MNSGKVFQKNATLPEPHAFQKTRLYKSSVEMGQCCVRQLIPQLTPKRGHTQRTRMRLLANHVEESSTSISFSGVPLFRLRLRGPQCDGTPRRVLHHVLAFDTMVPLNLPLTSRPVSMWLERLGGAVRKMQHSPLRFLQRGNSTCKQSQASFRCILNTAKVS